MTQPIEWNAYKTGFDTSMGLLVGEETVPRMLAAGAYTQSNGLLRLGIFRAKRTETITRVRMMSSTTAAVAPTDAWLLAYEVAQQGDGSWLATLVGQSATDVTLFTAASAAFTRALVAPFTKQAGRYYGVGALLLGSTTAPTVVAAVSGAVISTSGELAMSPPLSMTQTALAAIPATNPVPGNSQASPTAPYGVLVP